MALNIICTVFIFFFRDLSYRHIGPPLPVFTSTMVTLTLSFILITLSYFRGFHLFLSLVQSPLVISCFYFCPFLFLNNIITDSRYVLISQMLRIFNLFGNIVDSLQLHCSILKETFLSRKPFILTFWYFFFS